MLLSEIKFFNPKLSYILKESLKQKQKLKFKFDLTLKSLYFNDGKKILVSSNVISKKLVRL